MKHLVGFFFSIAILFLIVILNKYALKYPIPEFLIGWLSCTTYFVAKEIYNKNN